MLKLVNSLIGMVGIAMILYAVWLIRQWQEEMGNLPFADSDHPVPWYVKVSIFFDVSYQFLAIRGFVSLFRFSVV